MDVDQIDDLKLFISTTVSQQTSGLRQDLRQDFRKDLQKLEARLETKIDDLSKFVLDAIEYTNETTGDQLKDHELRITALEKAT